MHSAALGQDALGTTHKCSIETLFSLNKCVSAVPVQNVKVSRCYAGICFKAIISKVFHIAIKFNTKDALKFNKLQLFIFFQTILKCSWY